MTTAPRDASATASTASTPATSAESSTTAAEGSTGASESGGSSGASEGSDSGSSGGGSEGGGDVCVCTHGDFPACPDSANCQDEGALCCDAMDRVLQCVFNDIGTVWIPQQPPCK